MGSVRQESISALIGSSAGGIALEKFYFQKIILNLMDVFFISRSAVHKKSLCRNHIVQTSDWSSQEFEQLFQVDWHIRPDILPNHTTLKS